MALEEKQHVGVMSREFRVESAHSKMRCRKSLNFDMGQFGGEEFYVCMSKRSAA